MKFTGKIIRWHQKHMEVYEKPGGRGVSHWEEIKFWASAHLVPYTARVVGYNHGTKCFLVKFKSSKGFGCAWFDNNQIIWDKQEE